MEKILKNWFEKDYMWKYCKDWDWKTLIWKGL